MVSGHADDESAATAAHRRCSTRWRDRRGRRLHGWHRRFQRRDTDTVVQSARLRKRPATRHHPKFQPGNANRDTADLPQQRLDYARDPAADGDRGTRHSDTDFAWHTALSRDQRTGISPSGLEFSDAIGDRPAQRLTAEIADLSAAMVISKSKVATIMAHWYRENAALCDG